MDQETLTHAWEVLQDAYQAQMEGDYDRAVELYHSSLELHPTAEAHTFLGWTYHFQGKLEDAIAECQRAIKIDPDFGNPYNDIGAYMIEQGNFHGCSRRLMPSVTSRAIFRTTIWAARTWEKKCIRRPCAASRKQLKSSRVMRWPGRRSILSVAC
jgi:tetratricopeptide (TPR) repeat protein